MKKITIALMCMLLAAGAAMAQKRFTFGPKVGVDFTHFWGKETKSFWEFKGVFNYQAGAFFEYRFSNKFAIAPEVVFAAQGDKFNYFYEVYDEYDNVIDEKEGTCSYNVNYINVPVIFKYYVTPSFSIDLGPQIGVNIYSKCTHKEPGGKDNGTFDYDEETKAFDIGVGLGMTYNITNDVFVQGRYTLGFSSVFDWGYNKNGNAQIAIGYRF